MFSNNYIVTWPIFCSNIKNLSTCEIFVSHCLYFYHTSKILEIPGHHLLILYAYMAINASFKNFSTPFPNYCKQKPRKYAGLYSILEHIQHMLTYSTT